MFFVDDEHRGCGLGTLLLDHVIAERGVVTVDVNAQNRDAVAFYGRRGFTTVGRSEIDDAGRPYPLLRMRLSGR